jgi:hypothetical protein
MFAPNRPVCPCPNVGSTLGIYRPGDCTIFPEMKTTTHEAQQWEEVPNRREPYAAEMRRSSDRGNAAFSTQANVIMFINTALSDWFAVQYFAWLGAFGSGGIFSIEQLLWPASLTKCCRGQLIAALPWSTLCVGWELGMVPSSPCVH